MDGQKNVRTGCHREADSQNTSSNAHSKPLLKWQRILAAFLDGRSWHAIDAGRELHTTCLNSDVADLERRGLVFHHERISVPGYGGAKTAVVRYRLSPGSYAQAHALLGLVAPHGAPVDDAAQAYHRASGG